MTLSHYSDRRPGDPEVMVEVTVDELTVLTIDDVPQGDYTGAWRLR